MTESIPKTTPDSRVTAILAALVVLFIGAFGGALWGTNQIEARSPWTKDREAIILRLDRAEALAAANGQQIQQLTVQVTRLVAVLEKQR